jgi:predicted PurR-regulated permease PerM
MRDISIIGLFVLAVFYTLNIAASYLVPLFLAVFLHFILRPVFQFLLNIRVPRLAAAFLVVTALIAFFIGIFFTVREPAMNWIEKIPEGLKKIEKQIDTYQSQNSLQKTLAEVEEIRTNGGKDILVVDLPQASVGKKLFRLTTRTLFLVGSALVFLFFLLLQWDTLMKKIAVASKKKSAAATVTIIEKTISRYFFLITLINIALGILIAVALAFLRVPNPVFWGILAALTNYIPYAGAAFMIVILSVVACMVFPLSYAFWVPFVYWALTTIESVVFTPMVLGREMTVHPLFIVLFLSFWGWLWGIPGMILAVPILMTFRIVCEHVPALKPVAVILESRKIEVKS